MNGNLLSQAEILAKTWISISSKNQSSPTEEELKIAVKKTSSDLGLTAQESKILENSLKSQMNIKMDLGEKVIDPTTYHPWLAKRKAKIDFYYWNRYAEYLKIKEGWMHSVVASLGNVSDEILDLCGDPFENGIWKRKGLVLGDIQSGKTSTYLALCNKAADAGYKVIILLTGTLESLRRQTQERVDAGFVGLNSKNILKKNPEKKYIGVGELNSKRTAYQFTSVISDFNMSKLQSLNFTIKGLAEPVILVVKKQKNILENLTKWLKTLNTDHADEKIDLPLLLIDDEADNASVNTNKQDKDPTTINKAIVNVLKQFDRASYVAVTATPFANIFIDPDLDLSEEDFNLFPADFIYALSAPTNYIGPQKIYDRESAYFKSIEIIDDVVINQENKEYVFRSKLKTEHTIPYLPNSLKRAIDYFLLINVVRDLNGDLLTHRSMLVNVTPYVNVQIQVYEYIKEYVDELLLKIQSYSKLGFEEAISHKELMVLFESWKAFNLSETTGFSEKDILEHLYDSVAAIQIKLVNGKAKEIGIEKLDYEQYKDQGLRVIAIGGNSLSRGLTLEGLIVSYFDRNSQMYDTLLQMGRWFGYRKGYENLFKIWMPAETVLWYEYISKAVEELKSEIREMNKLGLTPKEFGLKVQQNMDSLFVTAKSKMRTAKPVERWIDLAAEVIETPKLIADKERLTQNLKRTISFLEELNKTKEYIKEEYNFEKNRFIYKGVNKQYIAEYIENFISHPRHIPFSANDLSQHIANSSYFDKWTVAIVGGKGEMLNSDYFPNFIRQYNLHYSKRVIIQDGSCLSISGQRARVGVPGATSNGLLQDEINNIKEKFFSDPVNKDKQTIPDKPFLRLKREPVLIIYFINIDKDSNSERKINSDKESINLIGNLPVVALELGFPGEYEGAPKESTKTRYIINKIEQRNSFNEEFEDEDE